ncbi:sporulation protein [Peribacillus asahii]|uniref:sporulation protein n=1 Tax=Peribacillus asahii TaxID=228899 RepID=UPI00207A1B38|nr:sporulation protein [Peribacillus asahii]USK58384.1 sporulation protein [Peribacillus asahii]
MSVFNKMLASLGIGNAKVDTKLEKSQYTLGETVSGVIDVQGGTVEQKIDEIYLTLHTNYEVESDDHTYQKTATINRYLITQPFVIGPNEMKEIPFSFQLPFETPLTYGKTKIWIKTGMDIKNAIDPTDQDYIRVVANPLIDSILHAVKELGFRLREVDCEEAPFRFRTYAPYFQEFEFVPVSGAFRGRLKELEFVFFVKNDQELEVLVELDRKSRGFAALFGDSEKNVRFSLTSHDIPNMKHRINDFLMRYI